MSNFETIKLKRDGGIATITINRPTALNALNSTVLSELHRAAAELATETDLDVVVITGEGRAFVAGADIKAMVDFTPEEAREFGARGHTTMNAIAGLPVPVIAAVNGFALGGGLELAVCADLLFGSEKAKLGVPEVKLGVIPGWGGTQRIGRLIGWHHARRLVYSGEMIDAAEAKRIGLLLDVFPSDELMDAVYDFAGTIARRGPLAVRKAKAVVHAGAETTLSEGLELERQAFSDLFGTSDQAEGMRAFLDDRSPEFTRS